MEAVIVEIEIGKNACHFLCDASAWIGIVLIFYIILAYLYCPKKEDK